MKLGKMEKFSLRGIVIAASVVPLALFFGFPCQEGAEDLEDETPSIEEFSLSPLEIPNSGPGRSSLLPGTDTAALQPATLQVIDAATRAPVARALVRWLRSDRKEPRADSTDPQGRCLLEAPGRYLVEIHSPEHPALPAVMELGPGVTELALFREGGLRLVFQDEQGQPVAGVKVSLENLEPGADLSRALVASAAFFQLPADTWELLGKALREETRVSAKTWKQLLNRAAAFAAARPPSSIPGRQSGTEGIVEWPALPATPGWRWILESGHSLNWNPRRVPQIHELNGGRRYPVDPPPGVSGEFEILPGELTEFAVTVYRHTAVRGRLASLTGRGIERGKVEIYDRLLRDALDGGQYRTFQGECFQEPRASGEFRLPGLRPGPKRLAAWWQEGEDELFFVQRHFDLEFAEDRDLGDLFPGDAHRARVRLSVVDLAGQPLDPRQLWKEPPSYPIQIRNRGPRSLPPEEDFWIQVPCRLGSRWEFCGLPAGRWELSTSEPFLVEIEPPAPPYGGPLHSDPRCEFEFPGPDPFEDELRWTIPRLQDYVVVLDAPRPLPSGYLSAWVLSPAGPELQLIRSFSNPRTFELPQELRCRFLEGPVYLLASFAPEDLQETDTGLYAFGRIHPAKAGAAPPRFFLSPGVRLRGQVQKMSFGRGARRLETRGLNFSLFVVGGESAPCPAQLLFGLSDGQGNFDAAGFPPGARLRWHGFTPATVETGPPGSILDGLLFDPEESTAER